MNDHTDIARGEAAVHPAGVTVVDLERFSPARYAPEVLPAGFNILYAGRLGCEQGVDLLAEAFLIARDRDPRLHLVLVGRGPYEDALRMRLGTAVTFLGWVEGEALASVYATADLFVLPAPADSFGQAVLQAQASGLPVLAVDAGERSALIENGRSGCLVESDAQALGNAIRGLARRAALRDRLATGGLLAVGARCRQRSLAQVTAGLHRAAGEPGTAGGGRPIDIRTAPIGDVSRAA